MKNLKKILSLALVFAFTLSLIASAAFTDDASIGDDYKDDVNMLVELGVLGGFPDGSFQPEKTITRAEFTKMAYVLKNHGDKEGSLFASQNSIFNDVQGNSSIAWAKGFINYCASQKIVGGVGGGKFNPNGDITVAEVAKMLLVILGCDPAKEGLTGPNWSANAVSKAIELGVFDGWVGNAGDKATRQLVAKLMRNTIFAPVYIYSPLTGAGSQTSVLDTSEDNDTLGEVTMDMNHVTGLVVANENYAIDTDEEGDELDLNAAPSYQPEDKSLVYYEYTDYGTIGHQAIQIDRALDDSLIGNLVDVYFKADGDEGTFANVEVIGNIIVNAKTKAYDVACPNIEMYPDGESTSTREITPYISFKVDDVEKKIEAPSGTTKVAMNDGAYDGAAFDDMCYLDDASLKNWSPASLEHPDLASNSGKRFFSQMGENSLAKYRIISVDGGETYSYIIKFQNNAASIDMGPVSNYNESKNTITLPTVGTEDLDDVILNGDIAQDNDVIVYIKNGKPCVEKVETITGAVTSTNDDDSVVINGETYKADFDLCTVINGSLTQYYSENKEASKEGTQYWIYDGFILDIDAAAGTSSADEYAVVINSSYDEDLNVARVKLAFSDNTDGAFEVSKLYTPKPSTPADEANDHASDFANNGKFGCVYKYSITDGKVDLSEDSATDPVKTENFDISGGNFNANGTTYYSSSKATMFLLYGNIKYTNGKYDSVTSTPIKAKAYKLSDITDINSKPIVMKQPGAADDGSNTTINVSLGTVVKDSNAGISSMVVGVMTTGTEAPKFVPETDDIAYVVSAKQLYNVATNKFYVKVKMISKDGFEELNSVDEPNDASGTASAFISSTNAGKDVPGYGKGTIIRYQKDSEGKLLTIDNTMGTPVEMTEDITESGLYYVNATQITDDLLGFFPYGTAQAVETSTRRLPAATSAMSLEDDGDYDIITISDEEYIGNYLSPASKTTAIGATDYNAIIQVQSGKIVKIFSFDETMTGPAKA